MNELGQIIQAILFTAPYAIPEDEIIRVIQKENQEFLSEDISKAILELRAEFQKDMYAMEIQRSGMGYSFVSKSKYYPYIVNYIETIQKKRLSKAALETLSIIAFKPDTTKVEIEQIRGVSADYAIDRLMERELVFISGRKDAPGQPATYKTTEKFFDYFGLESMEDLPKLEFINHEISSEISAELAAENNPRTHDEVQDIDAKIDEHKEKLSSDNMTTTESLIDKEEDQEGIVDTLPNDL